MNRSIIYLILLTAIFPLRAMSAEKTIRILAIGNSFSQDAVEQNFSEICKSQNKNVEIGNLYIPGCSIDTHYNNLLNNTPAYSFRFINTEGEKTVKEHVTLREAIKSAEWDYISFQQVSQYSGMYSTLKYLPEFIIKVRQLAGARTIFMWHSTWAYSPFSTHAGFKNYGNSQLTMYHDIISVAQRVMKENPSLKILIPSGTAIQNARTVIIAGKDLTRDGYHLDLKIGRYTAALCWYLAIFGPAFEYPVYIPSNISKTMAKEARKAATEAVLHPFQITLIPPAASVTQVKSHVA